MTEWSIVFSVLRVAIAIVVVLHVFLYFAQDRMLFLPQPLVPEVLATVQKAVPDVEELWLPTADGQRLHGWFVRNGAKDSAPALIYFGGNAEEVTGMALDAAQLPGVSFVLFNYRGYGRSTGEPGEKALFADALAIYDRIAARPGVDPKRIVAMGRSLGSGVATYLASQRSLSAVVLVSPYDSMRAVARGHYPFVLVDLILKHPFDSASRARTVDAPMLSLAAERDTIIPPRRAEALARAWRGPVTSTIIPGATHDDVSLHPAYWRAIREFLRARG